MNTIKKSEKMNKMENRAQNKSIFNLQGKGSKRKSLPTADFTNHRVSQSKNGVSQSFK